MRNDHAALVVNSEALIVNDCEDLIGLDFTSIPLTDADGPGPAENRILLLFRSQLLELKEAIDTALLELEYPDDMSEKH